MAKYRIGDRVYWEGANYATIVDIDEVITPTPTYYLAYYVDGQLRKASVLEPQISFRPTINEVKAEGRLVRRCFDDDWIFFYRGEYYVINSYDHLVLLDGEGNVIDE